MSLQGVFADRRAAGRALGRELAKRQFIRPIVLALPRGGVPVAYEVACALQAPLDLVMVGKIGAPGHGEFAIGAVVDGSNPQMVLDIKAAQKAGANEAFIARVRAAKLAEIERRRQAYGISASLQLKDRTAIVVDDGIATGMTAQAALKGIKKASPAKTVLAVPVAAPESLLELEPFCDEMVCLHAPRDFYAVGSHYDTFAQTSDAEVIALLQLANARRRQGLSK